MSKKTRYVAATIDRETALKYLVDNEVAYSEWKEAGMYHAVRSIICDPFDKKYSKAELDAMLLEAKNN